MFTINANEKYNSVEISFDCKPSEAVRSALKNHGFRWNAKRSIWYGFAEIDAVSAFISEAGETITAEPAPAAEVAPVKPVAPSIRFYYNGIKVNDGALRKCFYSLDNNINNEKCVTIYAHDCARLPRELFNVENDTDLYTDYFDDDRTTITPDHPLYVFARYAALKARAKDEKKHIEYLEECLTGPERWSGQHDMYREDLEKAKKYIAEFEAAKDPGQPTDTDLLKIDVMNTAKENARREAEHEAELEAREKFLNEQCEALHTIKEEAEANPIKDSAAYVVINWSEHPGIDEGIKLSVKAADNVLKHLNNYHREDGYYKTDFTIYYIDESGEESTYSGRYDIGSESGGLIEHVKIFGESCTQYNRYFQPVDLDKESDREDFEKGSAIIALAEALKKSAESEIKTI